MKQPNQKKPASLITKVVDHYKTWNSINGSGAPDRKGFKYYHKERGHYFVFNRG